MGVTLGILEMMHTLGSVITALLLISNCKAQDDTTSPEYIAKSAAEKSSIIMANIMEDTTGDDWYGILEMGGMFLEDMCPTFRAPGDELPFEGNGIREKYIHTVGTVAQVEWKDLGGHSYSGNLVAMYSVNGQDSWNFFKNDFTTHIGKAELELIPLILKFSEATNYVMEVGLSDWGLYGEDGIQVADA